MTAKKRASKTNWKSDFAKVDAHVIQPDEYDELPELTDAMIARGKVMRAGRPVSKNPRRQVTIRLPSDVLSRWRSSGPGWQTRMADRLMQI